MAQRAFDISKKILEEAHADTLEIRNQLALARLTLGGDRTSGVSELEAVLSSMKQVFGENDKRTLEAMMILPTGYLVLHIALLHSRLGKADIAIPMAEAAVKEVESFFGTKHPKVLEKLNTLAAICTSNNRFDLAIPVLEKTLDAIEGQGFQSSNTQLLTTVKILGFCYKSKKNYTKAIFNYERYRAGLMLREKVEPLSMEVEHLQSMSRIGFVELAECYMATKQNTFAIKLLE